VQFDYTTKVIDGGESFAKKLLNPASHLPDHWDSVRRGAFYRINRARVILSVCRHLFLQSHVAVLGALPKMPDVSTMCGVR
jgi:hypothetical protein